MKFNVITYFNSFKEKAKQYPDEQNSDIALRRIIQEVLSRQRKNEPEMYKLHAQDSAFQQAFFDTLKRMVQLDVLTK